MQAAGQNHAAIWESVKGATDNSPAIHRWDERHFATKSVKRTTERIDNELLLQPSAFTD